MWVRGADADGYVANYVETEQILITGAGALYSYVQVRGSIPLIWSQYPDLTRLPDLVMATETTSMEGFRTHYERMKKEYGAVVTISLTDNRGREKVVTDLFNRVIHTIPDAEFAYFDFHHECAHFHWANIDHLIQEVQPAIDRFGWSKVTGEQVDVQQRGIFRTSCIDCLDRTNVVQSMIARQILERQLRELGFEFDCLPQFRLI
jgi:hypothetical protein